MNQLPPKDSPAQSVADNKKTVSKGPVSIVHPRDSNVGKLANAKEVIMSTRKRIPGFIEMTGVGTAMGKTFGTKRIKAFVEHAGTAMRQVRIETGAIRDSLEADDLLVPIENFAQSQATVAGAVGVMRPAFDAIGQAKAAGGAIIWDWAGGLAMHRAEIFTAARMDERLVEMDIDGLSVVVTTADATRMQQAAESLDVIKMTTPRLRRALLLNGVAGPFNFPIGSEIAAIYHRMIGAAENAAIIKFPLVPGKAWAVCEAAGYSMAGALKATPLELAQRSGLDPFSAAACLSEWTAWWTATDRELDQLFRFREGAKE